MGTRNVVAVQLDGEYRIAQYGQWDGYPRGQGATVLKFLSTWDRPKFERKLHAASYYTDEQITALWREAGADDKGMIAYDKAKALGQRMPQIDRDMGAEVLQYVQDAPEGIKLRNSIDFAGDSLFCEWGYVLDLDENVLEVFSGFNHEPLADDERFARVGECTTAHDGTKYYPIRKVASYPLNALPTAEKMESDCERQEEAA